MPSPLAILTHTPLWVWAILALLIVLGIGRMRDQTTTLSRMLVFPAIMAMLSLSGLAHAGAAVLPAMLAGFALGGIAGWMREGAGATRRLADGRVWLRGDGAAPVLNVTVFAIHYVTSVTAVVNPALAADSLFQAATAGLSAALGALFIGRSAARLHALQRSEPLTG